MKKLSILTLLSAFILVGCNQSTPVVPVEPEQESMNTVETTPNSQTIVDVAIGNPDFSTLVTALQTAGLVETLQGEGPFTVFAPTNDAFAKIPADTLQAVLADKAKLTDILTYHVIADNLMAKDVATATTLTTVQGQTLTIKVVDGEVMVNDAQVVATDIVTSNGVIHIIDTVVMPK